jgi:hypothetical protein
MGKQMPENQNPDGPQGLRIRWEVPLPWLIGGIVVICVQAAIVYFAQVRQGELLAEQSITIRELLKQVKEINLLITSGNLKDVEHDLKISDHERRLNYVEAQIQNYHQRNENGARSDYRRP